MPSSPAESFFRSGMKSPEGVVVSSAPLEHHPPPPRRLCSRRACSLNPREALLRLLLLATAWRRTCSFEFLGCGNLDFGTHMCQGTRILTKSVDYVYIDRNLACDLTGMSSVLETINESTFYVGSQRCWHARGKYHTSGIINERGNCCQCKLLV
jgi:hypothetical protein